MLDLTTSLLFNLNLQTVLVVLIVVIIVQKVRQRLKYRLPPGPFSLPFIGTYEVLRATFAHEKFAEYRLKYGPGFQVQVGLHIAVVLSDIEVVTEALVKKKADFANRPQSPSTNVVTQGGKDIAFVNYTPTWKLHRKIAGKALRRYMAGPRLETVLHESLTKCLNLLADESGPFNPKTYIDLVLFNVLDGVIFGESAELDDPEFHQLMELNQEVTDIFGQVLLEDLFPILVKSRTTTRYRRLEKVVDTLIEAFRRKFQLHQDTFDQAGIDTSRHTIYFAIRYMASFPHIQSKVQDEIDNAVGGYDIPKDTMVIINHWALHRDPTYWKDADAFDPTRFLNENGKLTAKPESWLPFSMGRRVCLGETVAKSELHLIFSCIFQRFNISLAEGTEPNIENDGSSFVNQPASFNILVTERK